MMQSVVQRGNRHRGGCLRHRRRRQDRNGGDLATASITAWFIGFAPANDPKIAIAVHRRAHHRLRRPDLRGRSSRRRRGDSPRGGSGGYPRKGTVVDERYRLERKIGSGGMADVWLAEDTELDRNVAIKILHDRFAQDKRVRPALPARGPVGRRPPASERGRDLRPRRLRRHLLHRDGVRGRALSQGAGQGRDGRPRTRSTSRARSSTPPASPIARASSIAT